MEKLFYRTDESDCQGLLVYWIIGDAELTNPCSEANLLSPLRSKRNDAASAINVGYKDGRNNDGDSDNDDLDSGESVNEGK